MKPRQTYRGTRRQRIENGYWTEIRMYEAPACTSCPLKPECTRAKGNRRMYVSFRRFNLRGLEKVKTEWGLVCITHNMRKLAG